MNTKELYKKYNLTYSFYSRFVKRFLDIFLSLLAIIVMSPILIIFYFLTAIIHGFPAIYKQARPGKNHKIFFIYKFRSMNNKRDKNGNLLPDEQRITKYGKFIRKTSIDELPQLFNILKGDMSFVGPRPRLVKDMMFYEKEVFDLYLTKPGLTGPTQAYGRNKNTWEKVFEMDIAYAHHVTLWTDLKIFVRTFTSVFTDRGDSRSNTDDDKSQSKSQEYYYADYIKRIGKISEEQYDYGMKLSKQTILSKADLTFHPELHDQELFDKIIADQAKAKEELEKKKKRAKEIAKPNTDIPQTK